MKKRPAAIFRLNAAKIARDLGFEGGIDRFGQIMTHQDIFGRDRRVRLKLENKVTVIPLKREKRIFCGGYRAFDV